MPTHLPNRSNYYGIEIKGEAGSSGLTQEEKGKTKVLNVFRFEKATMLGEPHVMPVDQMPIGKRTTEEKEGRSAPGPRKKKGKSHEGECGVVAHRYAAHCRIQGRLRLVLGGTRSQAPLATTRVHAPQTHLTHTHETLVDANPPLGGARMPKRSSSTCAHSRCGFTK